MLNIHVKKRVMCLKHIFYLIFHVILEHFGMIVQSRENHMIFYM